MVALGHGGRIVTISSANAVIAGAEAAAYCATKAAVAHMTRCFAQDLIPYDITVNCVGPGATDTPLMIHQVDHPDALAGLLKAIPTGRMATPEEIAYVCAFYCTDMSAYLTGTFLLQDGGLRDHTPERASELLAIRQDRQTLSGAQVLQKIDDAHNEAQAQAREKRSKFGVK
eukprot:TRINITY_DN5770_c0_g1_i11.p1 TRINITY_DN5770_c0_g1~~TRINITY_DN5770_c0_g1_i11.p1  ORF type:complete len:172 (-),score=42.04 TRINITY_DN5770_c0_g1_i11:60-575(-)